MSATRIGIAFIVVCAFSESATAQSWVYQQFSNGGSSWNANNHNIPQGGAGYNSGYVQQPQPYYQPPPVQAPRPYQYNVPAYPAPQGPVRLNPDVQNPNNFSYLRPTSPPPARPTYVAPRYYNAPATGFRR